MKLLNAAIVLLALLATLTGYLQEKKRLATILALAPSAARDMYEKAQLQTRARVDRGDGGAGRGRDRRRRVVQGAAMIVSLFAVLVIVAVGGRATDALRLSQAESILARLSEADARAYYDILRRRVRKVIVMRALALFSLLCIFWVVRQRLMPRR